MTDPVVHLGEPGMAGACGKREPGWSTNMTSQVDCARCRGTLRFTERLSVERGEHWPSNYRMRMAIHQLRRRNESTINPGT